MKVQTSFSGRHCWILFTCTLFPMSKTLHLTKLFHPTALSGRQEKKLGVKRWVFFVNNAQCKRWVGDDLMTFDLINAIWHDTTLTRLQNILFPTNCQEKKGQQITSRVWVKGDNLSLLFWRHCGYLFDTLFHCFLLSELKSAAFLVIEHGLKHIFSGYKHSKVANTHSG